MPVFSCFPPDVDNIPSKGIPLQKNPGEYSSRETQAIGAIGVNRALLDNELKNRKGEPGKDKISFLLFAQFQISRFVRVPAETVRHIKMRWVKKNYEKGQGGSDGTLSLPPGYFF
jgi:hypothetical protein